MSYYDWQHITKPLTFSPVVQDTVENTKALSITPVQSIDNSFWYLTIPAVTISGISTSQPITKPYRPIIIGQFNYSAQAALTIIDYGVPLLNYGGAGLQDVVLAIRYRRGNNVYRYFFANSVPVASIPQLPYFPYTGQTIKGNFVIEVWSLRNDIIQGAVLQNINLKTGLIYYKSQLEDAGNFMSPAVVVPYSQLSTALPETLPTVFNSNGPWLDNP